MKVNLLVVLAVCLTQPGYGQQAAKLFSFGVIADVQYADVDKAGKRDYRNSLTVLENCVKELNKSDLAFVINLGDLIDRDYESFDKPLAILKRFDAPVHNVLGNHDFTLEDHFKDKVGMRLGNATGYFDFEVSGVVFIVLNGTDVSTFGHVEGSRAYNQAMAQYEEVKSSGANNAYTWNGGIGKKQMEWFENKLRKAEQRNKKVVVFCHWPLLPENGAQLWHNRQMLRLIENSASVIAWLAGHHHAGGYEIHEKIHHLTVKGIVEAESGLSCGIIDVYPDRLELKGYGDQQDQILKLLK